MDMCFFRPVSPLLWVVRIHDNPYALRFSGSFPGSGLPSFGCIAGCLVRTGLAIDSRKSVCMLRDPLVLDLAFAFAGGLDLHSGIEPLRPVKEMCRQIASQSKPEDQ